MQHHDASQEPKPWYAVSNLLTAAAIGGVVTVGAITAAPHVLPLIGVGTVSTVEDTLWYLHADELDPSHPVGSGVAGGINGLLRSVPFIGDELAYDGAFNALATGAIGIGGFLLGNHIAQHADTQDGFGWGQLIKRASLATSALIALPSVLSALSVGLSFLATVLAGEEAGDRMIDWAYGSLGTKGMINGQNLFGISGIAATLPHFITCGLSLIPAAASMGVAAYSGTPVPPPEEPEQSTQKSPLGAEENASLPCCKEGHHPPLGAYTARLNAEAANLPQLQR